MDSEMTFRECFRVRETFPISSEHNEGKHNNSKPKPINKFLSAAHEVTNAMNKHQLLLPVVRILLL